MNNEKKTLQDFKDEVAKTNDYPAWANVLYDLYEHNIDIQLFVDMESQAESLYAEHTRQEKDKVIKNLVEALDEIYYTLDSDDKAIIQFLPEGENHYHPSNWLKKSKEALSQAKPYLK